jgi:hypothetical protein
MLARAFLRICTLEAIRPSALLAADAGWPTIAGKYVSDSRMDPIDDDLASDERRPLIAVYSEDSHVSKIAQGGPIFYKGLVDLVFEISVVGKYATDASAEPVVDFADTDGATEAQLDALEDQIFWCLHYSPTGKLFRQMSKLPFEEWTSVPHRSGEEAIKLARRTVRAKIRVADACYLADVKTTPADLDRLPLQLKAIADQLGGSTYLAELALGLARTASVLPPRVDLKSVAGTVPPKVGAAIPAPLAVSINLQGQS